jgi:hypothetical protein
MSADQFLRLLGTRLHLIGADCFDLKAKERLRLLAEEIDRRLAGPPVNLSQPDCNDEATGK